MKIFDVCVYMYVCVVRPNCLQLEHQNYSSRGMLDTCENRKRENEKKKKNTTGEKLLK